MKQKGFSTMMVLLLFFVLSISVLSMTRVRISGFNEMYYVKNKEISKVAAETISSEIISKVNLKNPGNTITFGDGDSMVIPTANNCSTGAVGYGVARSVYNGVGDGGFYGLPANSLCNINDKIFTLRVTGYNKSDKEIKTEVAIGFEKQ
jgi:hypothetical protein